MVRRIGPARRYRRSKSIARSLSLAASARALSARHAFTPLHLEMRRLLLSRRRERQHRARCRTHHLLRDAPKDQMREAVAAVGLEHDQIRIDLHGHLVDRLREALERCEARMNLALQTL